MILALCSQTISCASLAVVSNVGKVLFFEETQTNPEGLFSFLVSFLQKYHLKPKDLQAIVVITGPGSFTSTRLMVVLANTIAFVQKIPIWGEEKPLSKSLKDFLEQKIFSLVFLQTHGVSFVEPFYDRSANIT